MTAGGAADTDGQIDRITRAILKFRDERDWGQFHTPRDLATGISIEAANLLELFLWKGPEQIRQDLSSPDFQEKLSHEIADVLIYSLLLANTAGLDVERAILGKLEHNAKKYPVELCRGRSTKAKDLVLSDQQ